MLSYRAARAALVAVALVGLASLGCDAAHPTTPPKSDVISEHELSTELERLCSELGIPGLSVAVARNGHILWSRGFGWADLEHKIPAGPHTVYPIASVTKSLSSVLAARLVRQGKLDLDSAVPTFSTITPPSRVSVRHVLTHTSEGVPGTAFHYNHSRFRQLTGVLETAAGERIEKLFVETLLDPLHFEDTLPGNDPIEWVTGLGAFFDESHQRRFQDAMTRTASLYRIGPDHLPILSCYSPEPLSTAGGVWSSATDLALFGAALDDDTLVTAQEREQLFTPPVGPDGRPFPYALGWFVSTVGSRRLVWHYGYLPGMASALILKEPERGLTFVALANSDGIAAPNSEALIQGNISASPFANAFLRAYSTR